MKIIVLTAIATVIYLSAIAQHQPKKRQTLPKAIPVYRYWLYTVSFQVDSGCENTSTGSFREDGKDVPGFDVIKKIVSDWVYPNKLVEFSLTSLKEITADKLLIRSDTFRCPVQQKIKISFFDTSSTGRFVCDTCNKLFYTLQNSNSATLKNDTIPVLAYCCKNFEKAKFAWVKLFGVKNYLSFYLGGFNGVAFFQEYLMPDRKTKSCYRVLYSISN